MLILTRTTLCELPSDTAALGFRPVLDHGDKGPSPTSCFFFVLYRGLSVVQILFVIIFQVFYLYFFLVLCRPLYSTKKLPVGPLSS